MANQIAVKVLKEVVAAKESAKGHTYIHFGGTLKARFKVLAEKAGWTRKLNDFGVHLFEQALAAAEQDVARQIAEAKKASEAASK